MKLWLLNTGYCAANEAFTLRGAPPRHGTAHALAALLEHPRHGLVLFDTGYAPRVLEAFRVFPFSIYGLLTPATIRPQWSAVAQLGAMGVKAEDVRTVIVSHLHADHIGGLRDFPRARFVLSRAAFNLSRLRGLAALRHAFLPMLLPDDFAARSEVIPDVAGAGLETAPPETAPLETLPGFEASFDLFGDGSVRLVPLPGHAQGQIGALLEGQGVFLLADGAWSGRAIREQRPPHPLPLHLFFDHPGATLHTLGTLHDLHRTRPDLRLVATHCPEYAVRVPPGARVVL